MHLLFSARCYVSDVPACCAFLVPRTQFCQMMGYDSTPGKLALFNIVGVPQIPTGVVYDAFQFVNHEPPRLVLETRPECMDFHLLEPGLRAPVFGSPSRR